MNATPVKPTLMQPAKRTPTQQRNRARIIDAALDVFSAYGYRGGTLDQIATRADLSKANMLYYYPGKEAIYRAVLEHTLTLWLDPLQNLDPAGEPLDEIWRYIEAKFELSRQAPHASRLFANEILAGAPMIKPYLQTELRELVTSRCTILQAWIDEGRLAPFDPLHLLFFIWSITQHYADFAAQITALHDGSEDELYAGARATLKQLLDSGLRG